MAIQNLIVLTGTSNFHKNKALNIIFVGQHNQDEGIQFEMMPVKK